MVYWFVAPVSFADNLFISINLDPVDLNFHKSGCRYIATLIRVLKYHTRCRNLGPHDCHILTWRRARFCS